MGVEIEVVSVVNVVVGRLITTRDIGAEIVELSVKELSVDVSLMICAKTILLNDGLAVELRYT
jgi:hypothetical protein